MSAHSKIRANGDARPAKDYDIIFKLKRGSLLACRVVARRIAKICELLGPSSLRYDAAAFALAARRAKTD
jgi:hypothetical protein